MSFLSKIKMKYSIVSTSAKATLADNLTKELQSRIDAGEGDQEGFKELLEWENEDEERWDIKDADFCANYISLLLDRNPLKWKNSHLVLWRGVKLKDIDQLNLDRLGVCWSYVTEGAKSYDHPSQMKGDDYVIEAEAPVTAIDYSIFLDLLLEGNLEEQEVRLKERQGVYNIKIYQNRKIVKTADTAKT